MAAINLAEGGASAEVGRGLVVEADGKVLVAGPFEANPGAPGNIGKDLDVAVIRLAAGGTLDASFGEGGIARIDLGEGKLRRRDLSDRQRVGPDGARRRLCAVRGDAEPRAGPDRHGISPSSG